MFQYHLVRDFVIITCVLKFKEIVGSCNNLNSGIDGDKNRFIVLPNG